MINGIHEQYSWIFFARRLCSFILLESFNSPDQALSRADVVKDVEFWHAANDAPTRYIYNDF